VAGMRKASAVCLDSIPLVTRADLRRLRVVRNDGVNHQDRSEVA